MNAFRALLVLATALTAAAPAAAQSDRYGVLADAPFEENRPTAETAALLKDELLFQRATQTYLWAMPLINTLGMKVGSEKVFGAGDCPSSGFLRHWRPDLMEALAHLVCHFRRRLCDAASAAVR